MLTIQHDNSIMHNIKFKFDRKESSMKSKIKKSGIVVGGLILGLLAGCSSKETAEETQQQAVVEEVAEETSQAADNDGIIIGYDIYYTGNTWSVQLWKEFEMAIRHLDPGVVKDVYYTQSDNSIDKQLSNIEDLITKGVDAIILNPLSQTGLEGVLTKARNQGIKVILLGTVEGDYYDAAICVDDYDFGVAGGKWLAEKLNGQGKIIVLNGIDGNDTSNKRYNGAMSELEKYEGIEVLAAVSAKWDYATAKTEVANLLAAYPEIDGVYSQGGAMTMGAIEAFEAAGRELVPMTGEDSNGFLKMWKERLDSGFESVAPSKPCYMSAIGLETAIKLCNGEKVEKDVMLEIPTITNDEIDDYVKPDLSDSLWVCTWMTDEEIKEVFPE